MRFTPAFTISLLTGLTLTATACDSRFLSFFGSNPPGNASGSGGGPSAITLDRTEYRVRLGVGPATPGWDAALLEAATVKASARWDGGVIQAISADSPGYTWELPEGLSLVARSQGPMLVAQSTATGSYTIRLAYTSRPSVQATATVLVSDDGAADVVIE